MPMRVARRRRRRRRPWAGVPATGVPKGLPREGLLLPELMEPLPRARGPDAPPAAAGAPRALRALRALHPGGHEGLHGLGAPRRASPPRPAVQRGRLSLPRRHDAAARLGGEPGARYPPPARPLQPAVEAPARPRGAEASAQGAQGSAVNENEGGPLAERLPQGGLLQQEEEAEGHGRRAVPEAALGALLDGRQPRLEERGGGAAGDHPGAVRQGAQPAAPGAPPPAPQAAAGLADLRGGRRGR